MITPPNLETRNLTMGHGKKSLCAPLDFSLQPGQVAALLGRNGSGKTTLLLTLAGLMPPLTGEVIMRQEHLSAMKPLRRARRVALMLSPRHLSETLCGREMVELGRWPHTSWHGRLSGQDHEKVLAAMKSTGTLTCAEIPLGRLSDGERQKLCIARALAQEAEVLLLDEPLSHLDAPSRREILLLLRHLAETGGKSVLFSCHELELAFRHAHQVLALLPDQSWRTGTSQEVSSDSFCREALGLEPLPFSPTLE